ncbi:MAG: hypothetical protein ACR2JB_08960 [Bryobacteraceae bacterium]
MKTSVAGLTFFLTLAVVSLKARNNHSFAQNLVHEIKAAHPEIAGLELAATKPGTGCQTIAATEAEEIGQKCDEDELTAKTTNRPFIEEEKTEFDVTLPIHDSAGKVIATAGMDFKLKAGRTKETVVREASKIGAELERRLTSESELFRPAE